MILGNVSSALLHLDYICGLEADILGMSETRLTAYGQTEAKHAFDESDWSLTCGSPQLHRRGDESRRNDAIPGGVGIATKRHIPSGPWQFVSDRWTEELSRRAVGVTVTSTCGNEPFKILQLYGYSNATSDPARLASNELSLELAFSEANACGDTPVIIIGDFNVEPQMSATIWHQLCTGAWVDVAQAFAEASGVEPQATYHGPRGASSRIDLCLINQAAAERVEHFEVLNDELCPIPNHRLQKVTFRTGGAKQRALRTRKLPSLPTRDPLSAEDHQALLESVLADRAGLYWEALANEDLEDAWARWSALAEDFLLQAAAIGSGDSSWATDSAHRGRGLCTHPTMKEVSRPRKYATSGDLMPPVQTGVLKCLRLSSESVALYRLPPSPGRVDQIDQLWAKCKAEGLKLYRTDLAHFWTNEVANMEVAISLKVRLTRLASALATQARRKRLAANDKQRKEELKESPSNAYKTLKADATPPLSILRRPDGTYTGNVREMDSILREAWAPIFQKHPSLEEAPSIAPFMAQYGHLITKHPQVLTPLGVEQIRRALNKMKDTGSAGLDGWCPKDLKALPEGILVLLVPFFALVEDLGQWPEALCWAAVTLIPKGEGAEPLSQRPLSVMPVLYRVWASARTRESIEWQERWVRSGQHGCRAKHGTTNALLEISLRLEEAMLSEEPLYGAALDFAKCFDYLPVAITLRTLEELGMSERILEPLSCMYANLQRRFKIRGYLGEPFRASNGVMQGDPLSVILLNALFSVLLTALSEAAPDLDDQSYVDDITLMSKKKDSVGAAFEALKPFLDLTGQRLNATKTYVFAIGGDIDVQWEGTPLPATPVLKTSGLRFYFGDGDVTYKYESEELQKVKATLQRIKSTKLPFWGRALTTGGLALSKVVYGSEVRTLLPEQERALRAETAACLWAKQGRHRSPGVIFTLLTKGHVCDPVQATLTSRVFRWAKAVRTQPQLGTVAWDMRENYGLNGISSTSGPVGALISACRRLKVAWTSSTTFSFPHGLGDFDVLECNWGGFGHALRESARRMVWAQTRTDHSRTRLGIQSLGALSDLGAPSGVDREKTLELYASQGMSEVDRGTLRLILAQGVWTNQVRAKLPESECVSPICPYCDKGQVEDLEHLWFHCEAWRESRDAVWPEGLPDFEGWPKCTTRCGILNLGDDIPVAKLQLMMMSVYAQRLSFEGDYG